MNPFTTDHPMAAQTSWFDAKEHPFLSLMCTAFVLALILTPFVLWRLLVYATTDIGAEPNPFPYPFWSAVSGLLVSFMFSLCCAFPIALTYRTVTSCWKSIRRRRACPVPKPQ